MNAILNPKFSIGDPVIIVDIEGDISDNNHFIIDMDFKKLAIGSYKHGKYYNSWAYWISNDPNNFEVPWAEIFLRPKPRGTGISMEEFMNKFKVKEEV